MTKIVGIRFRNVGKIYYFDPKNYKMKISDHVIVETARGVEFGRVVLGPKEVGEDEVVHPLKEVLRVATQADEDREKQNRLKEKEAFKICQKKIREHGLEMKLIDAEYTFDNNKVLFYFTADGRIDFRQLVKDLAAIFKTRIELRQIGVRDETKILGGIGICGRQLCCHTYLSEFAPVSIKMAKEQNLSLNQTKISGVCGRLMCCLKNEQETYEALNKSLPGTGDTVTLPDGLQGIVHSVNVLRQRVKVIVEVNDEKEIQEYPVGNSGHARKKQRTLTKKQGTLSKKKEILNPMEKNPQNDLVYPGERVDDLQNGLYVIQNPEKFCFGMDAVLLSGFADIRQNEKVLDMGTGTGIIPFLLKAKDKGSHLTGLEIQEECADMARRSVSYNHLEADIDIVCGDIKEAAEIFGAASFHAVTSNPPYMIGQHGLQNPYMAKAIARHEILCTLEDVVSQTAAVLKDRGRFYMVHRPFRLAEIFQVLMKYKLEPKRMQLVYPYIDREPNMVLIEARKGGNSRITVERPLIVYEKPGVYTSDILEIYGRV